MRIYLRRPMHPGEPILIICHSFPPNFGIGGRRWAKFAKELARRGHPVHVLCRTKKAGEPISLWDGDVQHDNIHLHPLPTRFPAVITRTPLTSLRDKLMYRFWLRVLPMRTKGNYFDPACLSRKDVLNGAADLVARHGIRQVVASGAPFSLLEYAVDLKHRCPSIQVTADLRDAWSWAPYYGFRVLGPARKRREQEKEAYVASTADRLITPHPDVVEHLRAAYPHDPGRYVCIPNVIDPDDLDIAPAPRHDGRFRMIYAGSFYSEGEADHYFKTLIVAFENLGKQDPEAFAKCQLDLYITGGDISTYVQLIKQHGMEGRINFHPPQAPKTIFNLVASSDLVLTFIPTTNKDILGTKFHEIFFLRRPILHIGEPGLVSRTITERRLGASLRVEELATELPKIIRGERKIEVDLRADHSAYLLGPVTDRLINEVLV